MITERHEELATLYTLGLLESEERRAFESELTGNAELQALEATLAEATATLALAKPWIAARFANRSGVGRHILDRKAHLRRGPK